MKGNAPKQKERPNQRKIAFRNEATEALLELEDEDKLTFEKAMEVAKLDCQQCKLHDAKHNPKHQNCRDNPFCIYRLGLEKFEKLINIEVQNREDAKKDHKRRDLNDQPSGLINSGNFCYVNSFIQVWFNNPEFRQIVYDFRPSDAYIIPELPRMNVQKVMLALQEVFYTLQTTPFFDTDRNELLTRALRLNSEQQDAQEFTLMLFDALDRNLQSHPNGQRIRNRIRDLYMGLTSSRIFCDCGMSSRRVEQSTSLLLNIDGYDTLMDALDGNFGVEKLDDFKCSECLREGHVSRESDYCQLPPVIIIQLNRYKYTNKGRQKLKTTLTYPREIPASAFQRRDQSNPPPSDTYELFAVTIHEGNNAECGHYYDLVKSPFNQKWYRYNDANVEVLAKPPGTDKPTSSKNVKTSKRKDKEKAPMDQRACYGLLYRRKDHIMPLQHPTLPPDELIMASKKELEEQFEGQAKSKIEKSEKRLYDLQRRFDKLLNTEKKLETYESKYQRPNEVAFIPTTLFVDIMEKEYEIAKGTKKKKKGSSDKSQEESKEGKTVNETETMEDPDISICESDVSVLEPPMELDPDKSCSDVDLLALAMTSSELPVENSLDARVKTRAQNGISKSVFGLSRSPRKMNGFTKPPVSTRVAALLDSHEMPICGHGKLDIETILFGDVKAVFRAPAIAFLREYDYRTKLVYDDGRKEYPIPEKDKEVHVFTAEDICMDCVVEMRREGIFNSRLDDDERLARKILKEEKLRCSVKCPLPKPDDYFYVAKIALSNFKKLAVSDRKHRLDEQLTKSGKLVFDSIKNQKEDPGFLTQLTLKRVRGRSKKKNFDETPEKITKFDMGDKDKEFNLNELPENFLDGDDDDDSNECPPVSNGNGVKELDPDRPRSSRSTTEMEEQTRPSSRSTPASFRVGPVEFNSELRCSHGGVNFNQFRHAVSPEEWDRFKYYFSDCFEVKCSDEVCVLCQQIEVDAQNGSENMRVLVREMRKRLAEVLKRVEIREENNNKDDEDITHGICSVFVEKLKKLSSRASTSPPQICQSCLFCTHGKPYKGFALESTRHDAHIIGLTSDEWNTFVNEIDSLEQLGDDVHSNGTVPTQIRIIDNKEIENHCMPCHEQFIKFKEEQKYMFDNESIYVRLVNPENDEDVVKTETKTTTRRRKNLFSVKMCSSSRLLDLKIALYDKCYQTPTDQLLYRNAGGDVLDATINEKTLYELRILPNNNENPLVLIAQQNGSKRVSVCEETTDHRAPERGFVDTALAH